MLCKPTKRTLQNMPRSPLPRTLLAILPIMGALLAAVAAAEAWPLPLTLSAMAVVVSASAVIYWSAPLHAPAASPGAASPAPAEPPSLPGVATLAQPSAELPSPRAPEPGSIGTRASSVATGEQYETDLLTGLLSPEAFSFRLRKELDLCREAGQSAILVLCDIDHFAEVNRNVGLGEANAMLRQVADSFRLTVREGDILARLGGDEFGIFFPGLPLQIAEHRVRDLRAAVREAGLLTLPDDAPQVTACIATSCFPDNGSDMETLLASAKQAMAAARRARQENADRPIASALVLSRD
jgi:diguanylate cyclase (GGDEF)-like protein